MRQSVLRSAVSTSLVLVLRLIVQAAALLLVARLLGPEDFGAFAGISALAVMFGAFSTFGTHFVLLGQVAKDPGQRESVLAYALPITMILGVLLLAVFLLACGLLFSSRGIPLELLVAIGLAEVLLQPFFSLLISENLALGRTAYSQLLATLPLLLRLIAVIVVVFWGLPKPLTAYAGGYVLASVASLGFAFKYSAQAWPRLSLLRLPTRKELIHAAGYAAQSVTSFAPSEVDKVLAAKLLPVSSAGLYSVSARIVSAVTLPVIALMLSALPRLFREGLSQGGGGLVRWIFSITITYGLVLAATLWIAAPLFVLLLGGEYAGVERMIRYLCFAVPGIAMHVAVSSVLMTLGVPWLRFGFEVLGMGLLAIFSVYLIPRFGDNGMPLALACSEWLMATLGVGLVIRARQRLASS